MPAVSWLNTRPLPAKFSVGAMMFQVVPYCTLQMASVAGSQGLTSRIQMDCSPP